MPHNEGFAIGKALGRAAEVFADGFAEQRLGADAMSVGKGAVHALFTPAEQWLECTAQNRQSLA